MNFKTEYEAVADYGDGAKSLARTGQSMFDVYKKDNSNSVEAKAKRAIAKKFKALENVKSVYLHGDPGCGKS
jgi:DNA replication protein DnaC